MLLDGLLSRIGSPYAACAVKTRRGRRNMERVSMGGTLWYGDLKGTACGVVDKPNWLSRLETPGDLDVASFKVVRVLAMC